VECDVRVLARAEEQRLTIELGADLEDDLDGIRFERVELGQAPAGVTLANALCR
jgi:hypothetical protein